MQMWELGCEACNRKEGVHNPNQTGSQSNLPPMLFCLTTRDYFTGQLLDFYLPYRLFLSKSSFPDIESGGKLLWLPPTDFGESGVFKN